MKIFKIEPIRFDSTKTGLVDVKYLKRFGFLWLKKQIVVRRAMSTTGILWRWVDDPNNYLHDLSSIIDGNAPELCCGAITINIGSPAQNELNCKRVTI